MKNYGDFIKSGKIILGAHRGDIVNYPENTMSAFRSAVELGVDAIETDVRRTLDDTLVLIHDRSVERTTGQTGNIDEMSLAQIKKLNAGFYKGEKHFETIPTVEEFLEFISKTEVVINWELKEYPDELGQDRAFATVDKLVALIRKYGVQKKSIMNSFSQKVLEYIADKYPGEFIIHGYFGYEGVDISSKPLEDFCDWTAIWKKDDDHPYGFKKDYAYADDKNAYTCILVYDTVENYDGALKLGCKMFTTNDIFKADKALKQLGKR